MDIPKGSPIKVTLPLEPPLSLDECWELLRSQMVGGERSSQHNRRQSDPRRNQRGQFNIDYTIHSCRSRKGPFGFSWAFFTATTPILDKAIDDFFASLDLSYDTPRKLWPTFKGLWHLPIAREVEAGFAKSFQISVSLAYLEFFGKTDVLPQIVNFVAQAPDLMKLVEPRQEVIRNPKSPYSRAGKFADDSYLEKYIETKVERVPLQVVAEQLMSRYIAAVHKCEHFKPAECVICGDSFHPESSRVLPAYGVPPVACENCAGVFDGRSYYEIVESTQLRGEVREQEQISNLIISAVLHYFREYSYIPASDAQRKHALGNFSLDLSDPANFVLNFKKHAIVAPGYIAKTHFGSNAAYLDKAGLFEGRATQGGYRSISSDGHVCLSLGERSICEFLSGLGIPHSKEPRYPTHATLNPNGLFRADFQVGEWLVEFAGRMSVPEYAARMQDKRKIAKEHGLNLLVLEPKDLLELVTKMKSPLATFALDRYDR